MFSVVHGLYVLLGDCYVGFMEVVDVVYGLYFVFVVGKGVVYE